MIPALFGKAMVMLKAIPPKVWLYIIAALLLVVAVLVIKHRIHEYGVARYRAGYAQAVHDIQAKAKKEIDQAKHEKKATEAAQAAQIATQGAKHDKELADLRALADSLSLRLRAASRAGTPIGYHTGISTPAGRGHDGAGGQSDDLDPAVVVPGESLLAAAHECERDRTSLRAWQEWYPAQKKIWDTWAANANKK